MAMGAKNRKTPIFEKTQIFRSKNTSDLRENICIYKDYFRERKNLRGGSDLPPPQKIL